MVFCQVHGLSYNGINLAFVIGGITAQDNAISLSVAVRIPVAKVDQPFRVHIEYPAPHFFCCFNVGIVPASLVAIEQSFLQVGSAVVAYRTGHSLEDELFYSLTPVACQHLINYAYELHGDLIQEHLRTVSNNTLTIQAVWNEIEQTQALSVPNRTLLGQAARIRKAGWFKSISWMEDVARTIVAPDLPFCDPGLSALVNQVYAWAAHGSR